MAKLSRCRLDDEHFTPTSPPGLEVSETAQINALLASSLAHRSLNAPFSTSFLPLGARFPSTGSNSVQLCVPAAGPVNFVSPSPIQIPLLSLNSSLLTRHPGYFSSFPSTFSLNNSSPASGTAPPSLFQVPVSTSVFSLQPQTPSSPPGPTRLLQSQRPQAADAVLIQIPRLSHPCSAHLSPRARPPTACQTPPHSSRPRPTSPRAPPPSGWRLLPWSRACPPAAGVRTMVWSAPWRSLTTKSE